MTSKQLPNKCDYCGLRVFQWHQHATSAQQMDKDFAALRELKEEGIIRSVPTRIVGVTAGVPAIGAGTTEFCAIDASAWKNKQTPCRHWQLRIAGAQLSDYLTIYHARKNQDIATALGTLAIVITVIIAIAQSASG